MTRRPIARLAVLFALPFFAGCKDAAPPVSQPAGVVVATVERRDVPVVIPATGTVEPIQTAAVAAQVDGIVERLAFREGDEVVAGQVLFQIDPRPYDAELAQAQAVLSRDLVQLANAERDRQRMEDLSTKEYVTQQQVDQARSAAAALAATVRADSAQLDRARLDRDRATVRAPITGRAGAVLVRVGNLVRGGSGGPLVLINQMAPILVRFGVPAGELAGIQQAGPGLAVTALPVGDTARAERGTLSFIDNAVDSLTGTILLKATFPNRQRALWPGALVRVRLTVTTERRALVLPVNALITGQQGTQVFVVGDSDRVYLRPVQVLRSSDSIAVLAGGVNPGDRVVTDGQVRVTDGARVRILTPGGGAPAP
jgi:multidrug efflux system membrane fusion protein